VTRKDDTVRNVCRHVVDATIDGWGKSHQPQPRGENTEQEAEYNRYRLLEEKSPSTEIRHT
jgi:hypothetical protein